MDWPSLKALLQLITFALAAQSCAGICNEASETRSSKRLSLSSFRSSSLAWLNDTTTFCNFCNTTYHALGVYSTQIVLKSIRKKYGDVDTSNVMHILRAAGIEIPDRIKTIWIYSYEHQRRNYLVDLVRKQIPYMTFKLNNLTVIDESRKRCVGMDVFGRNVILSDVMDLYSENLPRLTNGTSASHRFCNWELRILATEKFYIDKNVKGQFVGTDIERLKFISVVAPVWEVQSESGENGTIKLDGDHEYMEGGFFIGLYSKISNASKLFISANGADSIPEYDGGTSGAIHLVNTSGKVTVRKEACPGSGRHDGIFTEALYFPERVVADLHAEMITRSLFDCFSSQFEDFFFQLDSHVTFTISPLSLAREVDKVERVFYARTDQIKNCPRKIKGRMTTYYERTLELTTKQFEGAGPKVKSTLGIIASSIIGKLISNFELDRTHNPHSTIKYFEDVGKELKWLKKTFRSTNIGENQKRNMAVMKEAVKSKANLDAKVDEAQNFISKRINPAMNRAEDIMKAMSDKLLATLKEFLKADQNDLGNVEKMNEDFGNLLPFKYIFSGLQVVETVIRFFGPLGETPGPPGGSTIAGGSILGAFLDYEEEEEESDESNDYQNRADNLPQAIYDGDEENDTDYLSLIPQANDAIEVLVGQIKSNNVKREQLELAILDSKAKIKHFTGFIKQFRNTFIPALNEMGRDIQKKISILNRTSKSRLEVKNYNIRNVLSLMRRHLNYFDGLISDSQNATTTEGGKVTGEPRVYETLQSSFDSLGEAVEVIFELYGDIRIYQEWNELSKFVVIFNSPSVDEDTEDITLKLQLSFVNALVLEKHNKALFAFKQWVFPFPKHYLESTAEDRPSIPNITPSKDFATVVKSCKGVMDSFRSVLSEDMPATAKREWFQDYLHFTHTATSRPFYVWTNDKWQDSISRLFRGEKIHLKADVDMIGSDSLTKHLFMDRTAIKFIAIELFIKAHDESLQDDLNNALAYFDMTMTHSGLSIYKVNGQHFVMRNKPQRYFYYFDDGASDMRVDGYKAWPDSDFLLSPYTWWTFRIRNMSSYEGLQKFVNKVDLVLHGSGTYLDEWQANKYDPPFLNDLILSDDYEIYQPNDYEKLNVGEIQAEAVQRSFSRGPTFPKLSPGQTDNKLNLASTGLIQQAVESSINEPRCYQKLKCEDGKGEVSITGKFHLVSDTDNDAFVDYLKATGHNEDYRAEIRTSKMVNVTIFMLNNTKYYVETFVDDKKLGMSFKPGMEFQTLLGDGRKINNTINVNTEQKSATRIIKFIDFEATNKLIFCYWGFKVTLKAKDTEAVLTFRRL